MRKHNTRNQKAGWIFFILYLFALTYFMFFAESLGRTADRQMDYSYNLVLFREISRFITYRQILGWSAVILNLGGNVAGFVPCGFFFPIVSRRGRRWFMTLSFSYLLSLSIEVTQLICRVGSFDVDDLLLNTLGGMVGYIIYWSVQSMRSRRRRRDKEKVSL